jgi:nucleoside-diphosphate-sugar epimerase
MRILLTGGTGFIGKYLILYLKSKNVSVDNLSREILSNTNKLNSFLKNKQLENPEPYDVLIHLAANLDDSSKQLISVNVSLTKKLLKLCVKNKINRFIFASSHLVYGKTDYLPIDEEHRKRPETKYAKSKLLAEDVCKLFLENSTLQVTILRISSVFGSGQNEKYIIPKMFENALSQKIILYKYSNGYQLLDLIHVNDVIKAIYKACKSKKYGIYNLSSGVGTTSFNISKIILKFVNPCSIYVENKNNDTNHFLYDVSKIKNELNFSSSSIPNLKILKPWFKQNLKRNKSKNSRNLNNKRKV